MISVSLRPIHSSAGAKTNSSIE
uniref:Pds1 n=1 Tax=Arundo donax TaxID=35708 RepID=A0A0A9E155_ARUDO